MSDAYDAALEIRYALNTLRHALTASDPAWDNSKQPALDRIADEQARLADALAVQAKATLATFDTLGIAVQTLGRWIELAEARMDALAVLVETAQERTAPAGPRFVTLTHRVLMMDGTVAEQPMRLAVAGVTGIYPSGDSTYVAYDEDHGFHVVQTPDEVVAALRGAS